MTRFQEGVRLHAVALVVASALAVTSCAPLDRPPRARDDALASVACQKEIHTMLAEWGARPTRYLGGPPSGSGGRSLRFPTAVLGEWVVLEVPPFGPPVIARTMPNEITARLFDLSCDFDERRVTRPSTASAQGPRFTDVDLRESLLSADGRLVIVYAWAPHMPLSVDGYSEISQAAAAVGAAVVPLLIGHSDRGFAEREAMRAGIPADGLREIDANELILRDVQVHAPSILVFAPARISSVLPGYRNAEGYRRYLEAFIAPGR